MVVFARQVLNFYVYEEFVAITPLNYCIYDMLFNMVALIGLIAVLSGLFDYWISFIMCMVGAVAIQSATTDFFVAHVPEFDPDEHSLSGILVFVLLI